MITTRAFFPSAVGAILWTACATSSTTPPFAQPDAATAAPDTGVDAGPPLVYATLGTSLAPTNFDSGMATAYRAGYTLVTGTALVDAVCQVPPCGVDRVDVKIKFPSAVGKLTCDAVGDIAIEITTTDHGTPRTTSTLGPYDGTLPPSSYCMMEVTAYGLARVVGTFASPWLNLSGGVFDVPRGPDA